MYLLDGLREKLRFIEAMYKSAAATFVEAKRKIENSEDEFDYFRLGPGILWRRAAFFCGVAGGE